jgi:hypothetical protein
MKEGGGAMRKSLKNEIRGLKKELRKIKTKVERNVKYFSSEVLLSIYFIEKLLEELELEQEGLDKLQNL